MVKVETVPNTDQDTGHTRNCLAYGVKCGLLASFELPGAGSLNYYHSSFGITFVIGDPVCPVKSIKQVITAFLSRHPRACFVQVSGTTARVLAEAGYYANSFGVETELDLDTWQCKGPKAHMLRKNRAKAARAGTEIIEITADKERLAACQVVSRTWLQQAKGTEIELTVLTRPPVFHPEPMTRKFAAYVDGKVMGMAFFDPISPGADRQAYVYQIIREARDAPAGTRTYLLLSVADQLRKEGADVLSLGLSPLCLASEEPFRHGRGTRFMLRLLRRMTAQTYNYDGQQFYKSRFGGHERPVFLCSRSTTPLFSMLALLRDSGLIKSGPRTALLSLLRRKAGN